MSLLTDDPLIQLSFSVYENKGVFALLLGPGLSRAAAIPTGWEITLDLIRRVALAQGVEDQADWAQWYREKMGKEPNYSALIGDLASSPAERRSILHSYIEPSEEDRQEGRKVPTAAHGAIADLVRGGYIRVIVTTNFDRLMENALRERGIEPTIVSSVDALAGAEPITHSACYILKLHGDYKDTRILNTEAELSSYPPPYDTLLDRILDEHGLIVCGWSGEWDHALRAAFLRAPNRRYPVFWAARDALGDGAQQLVEHRRARVIPIADADSFFTALHQRVETLAQTHRQNPLSIELHVNSAKRFLARPEYRIQLDDLFAQELDRLIARLDTSEFDPPSQWDQVLFRRLVQSYEAATEPLARMAGVLGRWGDDSEFRLVRDIIRSLWAQAERDCKGPTEFVKIRSYPAVLVFTAYGLGLTRAERWSALHRLFDAILYRNRQEERRIVEALFLWAWKDNIGLWWQQIEGLESHKTALSDDLLILFRQWAQSFAAPTPDFELMFERFEMLGSLAHFERENKAAVQEELAGTFHHNPIWMPVGRSGRNSVNAERLVAEIQALPMKEALARAGFGKGDGEFIDLFIKNFGRTANDMKW